MRRVEAKELAEIFSTTKMSVSRWVRYGCPYLDTRPRTFDVDAVRQWVRDTGRDPGSPVAGWVPPDEARPNPQPGGAAPTQPARLPGAALPSPKGEPEGATVAGMTLREAHLRARLRTELLKAQKAELDLEKARGAVLPLVQVEEERLRRVVYARAILLGGPPALAPDVAGETIERAQATLAAWVDRVLRALAGEES